MLSRCATEDSCILKCLGDVELALPLSAQLLTYYQPLFSACIARAPVVLLTLAWSTLMLLALTRSPLHCLPLTLSALTLLALALLPSHCLPSHCLPSRCCPHAVCPLHCRPRAVCPCAPAPTPAPRSSRSLLPLGFSTTLRHLRVRTIPYLGSASQRLA